MYLDDIPVSWYKAAELNFVGYPSSSNICVFLYYGRRAERKYEIKIPYLPRLPFIIRGIGNTRTPIG